MRNHNRGVNSCRHPRHPELIVAWACVRLHHRRLCEQLRNNSSSMNNVQRSRTILPLTAFVCGGGERGNEIMLRFLAGCEPGSSTSRAGPGGEYQSLISWPCRAYGNVERLARCTVSTRWNVLLHQTETSLSIFLSSSTHWILTLPTIPEYCETTREMANYLSQQNPLSSYLACPFNHFTVRNTVRQHLEASLSFNTGLKRPSFSFSLHSQLLETEQSFPFCCCLSTEVPKRVLPLLFSITIRVHNPRSHQCFSTVQTLRSYQMTASLSFNIGQICSIIQVIHLTHLDFGA